MHRTPDGGFKWSGDTYRPMRSDYNRPGIYLQKHAHLFFSGTHGVLATTYPGIVQAAYNNTGMYGFTIMMSGNTKYSYIYPTFNEDGDLYGSSNDTCERTDCERTDCERTDCERAQESNLIVRALDKISDEYRRDVVAMNISHMQMPFLQDLGFANLVEATFEYCDVVKIPPLTSLRGLRKVSFSNNPRLTELPYDFLKHRVGELTFLNLINTGVRCIWGRIPAKLYGGETILAWFLPDQLDNAIPGYSGEPARMRALCMRMAEPVVRAAAAVMLVQKRGVVKQFHRDIARMIAGMILETKGKALWRPVYDSMYK